MVVSLFFSALQSSSNHVFETDCFFVCFQCLDAPACIAALLSRRERFDIELVEVDPQLLLIFLENSSDFRIDLNLSSENFLQQRFFGSLVRILSKHPSESGLVWRTICVLRGAWSDNIGRCSFTSKIPTR